MTPFAASIEKARGDLRNYLHSKRADYRRIQFLVSLIVAQRIVAGEIPVKLKPAKSIRI